MRLPPIGRILFAALIAVPVSVPLAAGSARAAPVALTLEEALRKAYETHPDVVSADALVRKAHLTVEDLRGERYAVTAELGGRVLGSQTGIAATDSLPAYAVSPFAAGSVGLTVPLFTGWKAEKALEGAGHAETAQLAAREAARLALALEVIKAFWGLRKATLALDILREAEGQARRAVESATAGQAAGRRSEHDVEQAQASLYTAQAATMGGVSSLGAARIAFATLLGGHGDEFDTLGDPPADPGSGPAGTGEALTARQIADAIGQRPDVAAARSRVDAAEAAVAAAKGSFWPQLAFSTTYQHGNNLFDQRSGAKSLGAFSGQWDALVTAKYNLFDLGKTGREVERAEQDLVAARAAREKLERQAHVEVATAQFRARGAAESARLLALGARLARRHHDWVAARKEQGYGLAIEVEDARSKLTVAELELLGARIDYVLRMADLQAALGKL